MPQFPIVLYPAALIQNREGEEFLVPAPIPPTLKTIPNYQKYAVLFLETAATAILAGQSLWWGGVGILMIVATVLGGTLWEREQRKQFRISEQKYDRQLRQWQRQKFIHSDRERGESLRQIAKRLRYATPPDVKANGNQGLLDADLAGELRLYFGDKIITDRGIKITFNEGGKSYTYSPDCIYHDSDFNLWIDIENDDPYYFNKEIQQYVPDHYIGSDDKRNTIFINRNWVIIRFAECQVFNDTKGCCKEVAKVIAELTLDRSVLMPFANTPDIKPVEHWTQEEAWEMIRKRTRKPIFEAKGLNHD